MDGPKRLPPTSETLRNDKSRAERLEALEELNRVRHEIEARSGIYQGDPVAEARAEQERQMEAWRQVYQGLSEDQIAKVEAIRSTARILRPASPNSRGRPTTRQASARAGPENGATPESPPGRA